MSRAPVSVSARMRGVSAVVLADSALVLSFHCDFLAEEPRGTCQDPSVRLKHKIVHNVCLHYFFPQLVNCFCWQNNETLIIHILCFLVVSFFSCFSLLRAEKYEYWLPSWWTLFAPKWKSEQMELCVVILFTAGETKQSNKPRLGIVRKVDLDIFLKANN